MLAFLANNALNTVTITSNKHVLCIKGEHCSAISVTDKLPLCDQMRNSSPQWFKILYWIGQGSQKLTCPRNLTINGTMS